MALRTTLLTCGAALLLAGCASVVTGTGHGSGRPAPASSPASPSPTATSSSPTAFPSTTAPAPALLRASVQTALGDPVTADVCRVQGLEFLDPLGYPTTYATTRYAAGCTFRAVRDDTTQVGVTEFANSLQSYTHRSGGHATTVHGLRVDEFAQDTSAGQCIRQVHAAEVVIEVTGYAIEASHSSPKICRAADLGVDRLTRLIAAHTAFPSVPLAANSIYPLDMCKIADAAHLTQVGPMRGSRVVTNEFGAECYLTNSATYTYIDVATVTPPEEATSDREAVPAGSHEVLAETSNSGTQCEFTSQQGRTTDGSGVEVIIFFVGLTSSKSPPPHLCATTASAIGKFLDAGGLR